MLWIETGRARHRGFCGAAHWQQGLEKRSDVVTGGSGVQYDSAHDIYQYNWKTAREYAQTCRQLVVTLNDGTNHVAYFAFH